MNVAIIDNEKKIVEGLRAMMDIYCPDLRVLGSAGNVRKAIELLNNLKLDLVFLDIELNDGTGLDVLKTIENLSFKIIFITAYDKYAIEAFKYSAIDFLLKPIDPDDLIQAVEKAKVELLNDHKQIQMKILVDNLNHISIQNRKIVVSDRDSIHAILVKDIYYLEADGAYTKFILGDQVILASKNLKTFEDILLNAGFFRTHHSFLVNISQMAKFDKSEGMLILNNGKGIAVSYRKKDALLDMIRKTSII